MGGQSSGYQSQPMNQWGGGQRFGGGGFGGGFGGYGNGGYMPKSFNQQGYGQPQGFGWNNNFSNGFGGWNQFGGWPQFNGFQSGWQPQYQQPQSQQPQFSPASQDMNQDMFPTRAQGMVRLPPINYDQYQKQPNQYEYLNGGNSPFSQVA